MDFKLGSSHCDSSASESSSLASSCPREQFGERRVPVSNRPRIQALRQAGGAAHIILAVAFFSLGRGKTQTQSLGQHLPIVCNSHLKTKLLQKNSSTLAWKRPLDVSSSLVHTEPSFPSLLLTSRALGGFYYKHHLQLWEGLLPALYLLHFPLLCRSGPYPAPKLPLKSQH